MEQHLLPNGQAGYSVAGVNIKLFPDGGAEITEPSIRGWGPPESNASNMFRVNAAGDVLSGKPRSLAHYPELLKLLKEALGVSDKP